MSRRGLIIRLLIFVPLFAYFGYGAYQKWRTEQAVADEAPTSRKMQLPDGRTIYIGRDITQHKRADEALRRSEERERARARELETLMDAAPAAVWVAHDRACARMSGNRASYELLRLPTGVNTSQSGPEAERPRHFRVLRGGQPVRGEELPMQLAAARGVAVHDTELELLFDDGARRFIYGNAAPFLDQKGQPAGAIGVFVDITERRLAEQALSRSEERFRSLVAASATVVWNVAQSGEPLGAHPQWQSYTGQGSPAAHNNGWLQMVHPEDRAAMINAAHQSRQTGQPLEVLARFTPEFREAIDVDDTGTALAGIAAHMRAGHAQLVAQQGGVHRPVRQAQRIEAVVALVLGVRVLVLELVEIQAQRHLVDPARPRRRQARVALEANADVLPHLTGRLKFALYIDGVSGKEVVGAAVSSGSTTVGARRSSWASVGGLSASKGAVRPVASWAFVVVVSGCVRSRSTAIPGRPIRPAT